MFLRSKEKPKEMSDSKPDISKFPKASITHPLLLMLPEYLKDPKNYNKIEKAILDTFRSNCGHTEVLDWATCKKCTNKMLERRMMLKKLGFVNPAQYYAWKKVHQTIQKRIALTNFKF